MWLAEMVALFALLGVGVWLFRQGLRLLKVRRRMTRWPRVPGTVLEHSLHARHRHYRPRFLVEYSVRRGTLRSVCDSPIRAGYSHPRGAETLFKKYPVGATVLLFVNPRKPRRAHLWLPELHVIITLFVGAVLFLVIAGVGWQAAFAAWRPE